MNLKTLGDNGSSLAILDTRYLLLTGGTLTGGLTVNEDGNNVDTRMEGDTDANAFFLKGSNNRIGFGTNSPIEKLHVIGNFAVSDAATPTKSYRFRTTGSVLDLDGAGSNLLASIYVNGDFTGTQQQKFELGNGSYSKLFYLWEMKVFATDATTHSLNSEGGWVFNEQGSDYDYRMEGDTDQNVFFLDASTDRIGIGMNTPSSKFTINGDLAVVDGMTAPGTTAGYAKIYVDTADGDLKVKFGDGVTKVLAADT